MAWILPNPSGLSRSFTLEALVRAYSELRAALPRPATAPGSNASRKGRGSRSEEIRWRRQKTKFRRPVGCMKRGIGKLYHLAEASNLASILQHGLMSTERLLDLAFVAKPSATCSFACTGRSNIWLSGSVVIRDQRPMPPAALVRALDDGLEPPIGTRS